MMMTKLNQVLRAGSPRRPANRRGVLLLVVLGMLAMFGLIGLAFVMLTGHARRGAEALRRKAFYAENHQKFTEEAIFQILRGSTNPNSVLQNHSLLEDVYGTDTVAGEVSGATDMAGAAKTGGDVSDVQLLRLGINTIPPHSPDLDTELEQLPRVGRILTFTSGDNAGQSVRIVGRELNFFYITSPTNIPSANDTFIINGAAFSGTGFGYNLNATAGNPQLSAQYTGSSDDWLPWSSTWTRYDTATPIEEPLQALFPNPVAYNANYFAAADNYTDPSGPGGANEDYDAADYQNMLLAYQEVDGDVLAPSLHRPSLINFWDQNALAILIDTTSMSADQRAGALAAPHLLATNAFNRGTPDIQFAKDLLGRLSLRPSHAYHPNFTGSNPNYWPLWDGATAGAVQLDLDPGQAGNEVDIAQPEWDVDNDGDGIKDSIWVDLGLPVQTSKDGRQYKPLVAILCIDLDGRLNLNAHGTLADALDVAPGDCDSGSGVPIAGGAAPSDADRGQGTGTAEVSLTDVLGASGANSVYDKLLRGDETNQIPGRYGADSVNPSLDNTTRYTPSNDYIRRRIGLQPGVSTTALTVTDPPYDFRNYPYDYFTEGGSGSLDFGSPVDLKGSMQVALDHRGQPIYQIASNAGAAINLAAVTQTDALIAQPYELDLSPHGPRGENLTTPDAPYSPSELERLLRPYDIDAMNLPDRLIKLLDPTGTGWWQTNDRNRKVTTESWDIASVPFAVTAEILADMVTARSADFPDRQTANTWLEQFPVGLPRLLAARIAIENTGMSLANIESNFTNIGEELLGPELMAGLPLNLNRKFTPRDSAANIARNNIERRAMARQLYCLTMLLADLNYLDTVAWQAFVDPDPGSGYRGYTTRLLAQWAVNVVDFRCNDSIMTPFEYDQYPFENAGPTPSTTITPPPPTHNINANTWNVDGFIDGETYTFGGQTVNVASTDDAVAHAHRAVVWGAARPELLITETLAFHARRTEDLSEGGGTISDSDNDFDQRWMPQGSLFVELYNPWSPKEAPTELYNNGGIDLTATTATGNSPVWRLVTTTFDPATPQVNVEDPNPALAPTIERAVYFVQSASYPAGDDDIQYYPDDGMENEIAPILPGSYALIGPDDPAALKTSDNNNAGQAITYIGSTPASGTNTDRRIVLQPAAAPGGKQVWVYGDGNNDDTDATTAQIQNATAIVINAPRRLSVTEPINTSVSPASTYDATGYTPDSGYTTIFDTPLDRTLALPEWDGSGSRLSLKDNNTVSGAYVVHLQRLANPDEAFNATTNPYLTLDRMPIDVTSFNGVTTNRDQGGTSDVNEADGTHPDLFSRERSEKNLNRDNPIVWAQDAVTTLDDDPVDTQPAFATAGTGFFTEDLSHSLGHLNGAYRQAGVRPLNTPSSYLGSPNAPFPWLNWNNRPYMSKNELLMVPYASSSLLLQSFEIPAGGTETYAPTALMNAKFTHLPNLLNSDNLGGSGATELHRILDYVRVPSRFVKTREPLMGTTQQDETYREITDRREPGRVNLNTVDHTDVWNGVTGTLGAPLTNTINNAYPTRFPNPYRSAKGLSLVPTQQLMTDIDREVNATLLRENAGALPLVGNTTDPYNDADRNPYFRYLPLTRLGNTAGTRSNVYAVWVTVGYFEVEPVVFTDSNNDNLDDVLLCNSSDFPTYAAKVYPDGVMIGQELGADSGEVSRNRAFYMIDRSIPVGFQRGQNLNVEDAILIGREIE